MTIPGVPDVVSVMAYGPWEPAQVSLREAPSGRIILPEVEAIIEETWQQGLKRTAKLFDGPTCRLEGFEVGPGGLTVRISRGSYKAFYGTNLYHPELRNRFGPGVMANPLGLSPALVTADGYLVFGRRNHAVAYYPGRVHPFSGALEPGEDPFEGVRRELAEELSLSAAAIGPITLLGLIEERQIAQPEFIFHAATTRTLADVRDTLGADEHQDIVAIPAGGSANLQTIFQREAFTPVAVGTIELYRRFLSLGGDSS